MNLDDDTEAEVIGEMDMGEWITVIEPDGSSRDIETHVEGVPWHRPPPDGSDWMTLEQHFALLETTVHLL